MFSSTNKVQNLAKKVSDNKFTKMTKLANALKKLLNNPNKKRINLE